MYKFIKTLIFFIKCLFTIIFVSNHGSPIFLFVPRLFLNLTNTKSCRDVKSNSENGIQGHPIFSLSGSDFSFVSSCLYALSIAGKEWIIILPNQRNRGLNPHLNDLVMRLFVIPKEIRVEEIKSQLTAQ